MGPVENNAIQKIGENEIGRIFSIFRQQLPIWIIDNSFSVDNN